MSGGGGTNTVQKADPWGPIQPYLEDAAGIASDIYQGGAPQYYPGNTYLGPNPYQQAAISGTADYAGSDALQGLIGSGYNAQLSALNPYSNPYVTQMMGLGGPAASTSIYGMGMMQPSAQAAQSVMGAINPALSTGLTAMGAINPALSTGLTAMTALNPALSTGYDLMNMARPAMGSYGDIYSMLQPSMQSSRAALGTVPGSAATGLSLQQQGLNYDPNLYTPGVALAGVTSPDRALSDMMYGGGSNPYLDAMVRGAQSNTLQNYQTTADAAADAYQYQMLPQIQQARTLIDDALGSFTEQALPQIADRSIQTGNVNSTRRDLAEATALTGIYDSLNRQLGNIAQTADITGANIYQDLLRNQSQTLDDLGSMASQMYGGAWNQQQQNILGAANTAAGLQQNINQNLLGLADLDLRRQIAGQDITGDWADRALQSSLGWGGLGGDAASLYSNLLGSQNQLWGGLAGDVSGNLGTLAGDLSRTWAGLAGDLSGTWGGLGNTAASNWGDLASGLATGSLDASSNIYDTALSNQIRSMAFLPQTAQMGTLPASLYGQAGDLQAGFNQAALQADMDRWNYNQNLPSEWFNNYLNQLSVLGGQGGQTSAFSDTASNPYLGAAGGALMGGMLGGSLFPSAAAGIGGTAAAPAMMFNPYTAIAGLALGALM